MLFWAKRERWINVLFPSNLNSSHRVCRWSEWWSCYCYVAIFVEPELSIDYFMKGALWHNRSLLSQYVLIKIWKNPKWNRELKLGCELAMENLLAWTIAVLRQGRKKRVTNQCNNDSPFCVTACGKNIRRQPSQVPSANNVWTHQPPHFSCSLKSQLGTRGLSEGVSRLAFASTGKDLAPFLPLRFSVKFPRFLFVGKLAS